MEKCETERCECGNVGTSVSQPFAPCRALRHISLLSPFSLLHGLGRFACAEIPDNVIVVATVKTSVSAKKELRSIPSHPIPSHPIGDGGGEHDGDGDGDQGGPTNDGVLRGRSKSI